MDGANFNNEIKLHGDAVGAEATCITFNQNAISNILHPLCSKIVTYDGSVNISIQNIFF